MNAYRAHSYLKKERVINWFLSYLKWIKHKSLLKDNKKHGVRFEGNYIFNLLNSSVEK